MTLREKTLKLCRCNGTIPLDARALATALKAKQPFTVHTELCRKESGAFQAALNDPDLIVACTQEAPLFTELAAAAESKTRLAFANIREAAGWSAEGAQATPKIAALLAAAALPEPEPVPAVAYRSGGALVIIGPAETAIPWAERLATQLEVSVLLTSAGRAELPSERRYPIWSGRALSLAGWLGAFELEWQQENPIDLDLCTRCNGCVRACPEQAIDFSYQIDLGKCKAHRECVKACGAVGAIDFSREAAPRKEQFDLVLDLSREPLLRLRDLPQGYAAPGGDPLEQALAVQALAALVGEFEKPRFIRYRERICAHSRSGVDGCNRCLDVCSTGAIRADGDYVKVETHLCAGCGGCATVCPSGAMGYAYPGLPDMGMRLKTLLATYREAGGGDALVLFHDTEAGRALVHALGRRALAGGRGMPARAIPLECHHGASVGMDLALAAIAYGASQVRVLVTGREAETYVVALQEQLRVAGEILAALGYAGEHFGVIQASEAKGLEQALWSATPARTVERTGAFNLAAEKRTALDFVVEHLASQAPARTDLIALTRGAPFGTLEVNKETCTLCKACIGACPTSALVDSPEALQLRFIERNCVQCGLCANTCPEKAIGLVPRLLLAAQAKEPVVLNEDQPFRCVRCSKPFGTKKMIDAMLTKVAGHSMFATGAALKRLQMCADCRLVDLMENRQEATIFDFTDRK